VNTHERDLIGYANNPPQANWPDGARIALQIVLAYEEGSERTPLNGDGESESFISEIVGVPPVKNLRNPQAESIYEYGSRVGFWRIHNELSARGIPVTVLANGLALELNPVVTAAIVDANYEVASHGYRWIDYQYIDEDTEREHMKRAVASIETATGTRPAGWYTGRLSPNTRKLVVEHGGFLYDADSYADDLPYYEEVEGRPHLIVPYTLEANDMKWVAQGGSFASGEQYFSYLKDTFDVLYAEGVQTPRMMSTGLHCRIAGRPGRFAALQRFLDYVQSKPDVWICRREDIARHWWATNPPIGYDQTLYPSTVLGETA
jgi:putative urate catabolism protein